MVLAGLETKKVEKALKMNSEFKRLHQKHGEIEEKLSKLGKSLQLTADQQLEKNRLKKMKLTGKDSMNRILNSMEFNA